MLVYHDNPLVCFQKFIYRLAQTIVRMIAEYNISGIYFVCFVGKCLGHTAGKHNHRVW